MRLVVVQVILFIDVFRFSSAAQKCNGILQRVICTFDKARVIRFHCKGIAKLLCHLDAVRIECFFPIQCLSTEPFTGTHHFVSGNVPIGLTKGIVQRKHGCPAFPP